MIAQAQPQHQLSAGVLALLVHIGFFAFLIFSVNWRTVEPPGMVVDLWADIPTQAPQKIAPPPKIEPTPKPEPMPVKKIEPKPVPPTPISKADIALKDKKPKAEKPKPKPEPIKPTKQEQLKQKELLQQEEIARQQQAQTALAQIALAKQNAAQKSVVNEYSDRIRGKIRQRLNRTVCGDGNPLLKFDIAVLPTGQILGNPVLRKSSGIPACDKAVETAILQSDPLPVPTQPEIFAHFRDLHLEFKPNE